MLSFKNFLLDQDDNIDQEEAVKRYNNYKTDFKKTQISEFFIAHKDEEWFVENFFIMNLNFSFFFYLGLNINIIQMNIQNVVKNKDKQLKNV